MNENKKERRERIKAAAEVLARSIIDGLGPVRDEDEREIRHVAFTALAFSVEPKPLLDRIFREKRS